jgi:hypothetical protein
VFSCACLRAVSCGRGSVRWWEGCFVCSPLYGGWKQAVLWLHAQPAVYGAFSELACAPLCSSCCVHVSWCLIASAPCFKGAVGWGRVISPSDKLVL